MSNKYLVVTINMHRHSEYFKRKMKRNYADFTFNFYGLRATVVGIQTHFFNDGISLRILYDCIHIYLQ